MKAMDKKPSASHWVSRHGLPCIARSQVAHVQHKQIGQILRNNAIHAKLTIGQPNDKYDQEVDRMADQIMRMPEPAARNFTPVESQSEVDVIQRTCASCSKEYDRAVQERRPVNPVNLCPKCRATRSIALCKRGVLSIPLTFVPNAGLRGLGVTSCILQRIKRHD